MGRFARIDSRFEKIRAACLQNETAPEKLLNRSEKQFEKREKKIRKTIRNAFESILAPLGPFKNILPALQQILKVFHRPKFAQQKKNSPRGSAGVATLRKKKKKKNLFFANRPSRKWIAARIGRESREFQCESERDAIHANLAKCFKNRHFFCGSICVNLRNVGVRIACPLRLHCHLLRPDGKSTYKEHSRKGPRHRQDLSRKSGKPPRFAFTQQAHKSLRYYC